MRNKHTDKKLEEIMKLSIKKSFKEIQERNIRAVVDADEIKVYTKDFFKKHGKEGGKKGGWLKWKMSDEEKLSHMKLMSKKSVEARRKKISTDS